MPRLRRTSPDQPGLDPPPCRHGFHLPRRVRRTAAAPRTRSAARTWSSRRPGTTCGSRRTPTATSRRSAPTTPVAGSTSTTRTGARSRDAAKFARIIDFGKALSRARERVLTDLGSEGMSLERACAVAVRLLDLGYFRIGNDVYADTNGSFGLTTLRKDARLQARRHPDVPLRRQVGHRARHLHRRRAGHRGARRDATPARWGDELLAWKDGSRWRDLDSGHVNDLRARGDRDGGHRQGLPHLARHRARVPSRWPRPRSRGRRRRPASGQSRAR